MNLELAWRIVPYFSLATFLAQTFQRSKQPNKSGSYGSKYFPHDLAKNGTRQYFEQLNSVIPNENSNKGDTPY